MNRKKHSAKRKVSIIIFIALLVHTAIFYVLFSNMEIVGMLESSTYRYYEKGLSEKANKLEKKMANDFSSEETLNPLIQELEKEFEKSELENKPSELNKHIVEGLLESLNKSGASGAFVLFSDNFTNDMVKDNQMFFIRDENNDVKVDNNSDIRVEVGSAKLANELKINFSSYWKPSTAVENSNNEVLQAIKSQVVSSYQKTDNKNPKKLGVWLSEVDISGDNSSNMLYVRPVIDKYSNKLYGIIGIEVDKEVLSCILETESFSSQFEIGFSLLKDIKKFDSDFDLKEAHIVSYFGSYINGIKDNNKIVYKTTENKNTDSESNQDYKTHILMEQDNLKDTYYVLTKTINIYDKDSYYSSKDWVLALFVNCKNISLHEDKYNKNLSIVLMASLIIAIFLSIIISIIITKPVRDLTKNIENINIKDKLKITKTNIVETDLLINKIENLSENISRFYFKMQNLLEFVGFNIVIIEEDTEKNLIYRTGRMSVLFGKTDESEEAISEYTVEEFLDILRNYADNKAVEYFNTQYDDEFKVINTIDEKTNSAIYISYVKKVINGKPFHIYSDYTSSYNDILALEQEKNHDHLTGLMNRDYFKKMVIEMLEQFENNNFVMIMWDLDNLKYINDNYGHDWGDVYLKETAKVISTLKLDEDAFVSRFSGDEFFAFIQYDGNKNTIREKINALHDTLLNTEIEISNLENLKIRASVGISWYPEDGQNYEELHKFSDFAMYRAKHTNKGSIIEFDKNIYESEYIVLSGKEEFNRLIEKKLVKFAFQPIISAKTGEVFGYEALMRTTSDVITNVGEVMKIAKVQFKLPLVEKLTFEGVFDEIEARKNELKDKKVFINSIANVVIDNDFEEIISQKLKSWGNKIVIEITESEEVDNKSMSIKKRYREMYSNLIAIDDMGSGYSTEKTLIKVNPDFIKIDMSIIRDIHKDHNRYQLVQNIIGFAHSTGIQTIAEGVEIEEEMNTLIELGIDYLQGYYLAKPSFEVVDIKPEIKEKIKFVSKNISNNYFF